MQMHPRSESMINKTLLVEGPPGSGKTEYLVHCAESFLEWLPSHQSILALTFTNKASSNLRTRLATIKGNALGRRRIEVHNLHGFAIRILRSHGNLVGLIPGFPQNTDLPLMVSSILRQQSMDLNGVDQICYELGNLKKRVFRSQQDRERSLFDLSPSALAVESFRLKHSIVTYDDLIQYSVQLLANTAVRDLYQARFGALILDEYQDLTPIQYELAQLSTHPTRVIAGDDCQGIYTFAGADSKSLRTRIMGTADFQIELRESHRSSPQVLNALNIVRKELNKPNLRIVRDRHWPCEGHASKILFHDEADEVGWIENALRSIFDIHPGASVAIIANQNWRLEAIADHLSESQIEFSLQGKRGDLYHDLISILSNADQSSEPMTCSELISLLKNGLFDITAKQIADFSELVEIQGASTSSANYFLRNKVSDERTTDDYTEQGVHLLTVHKSKGREFDWTFVVGLEHNVFPHKRSAASEALLEEDLRLLHVAISRAKFGCVCTRVSILDGSHRPGSSWWDLLILPPTDPSAYLSGYEEYCGWKEIPKDSYTP